MSGSLVLRAANALLNGPVSAWMSGSAHKLLMAWFDAGLSESVSVEL